MKNSHPLALAIIVALLCTGCSAKPAAHEAAAEAAPLLDPIEPGSLMADNVTFEFAIYYLPKPSKDPSAELDDLLKDQFKIFQRAQTPEDPGERLLIAGRAVDNPRADYPPPDTDSLKYFGRGLSPAQARSLAQTESAFVLDFIYPKAHVWDGMRAALQLTENLARRTNGLIWDEATRELFTPDEWQKRRLADWTAEIPHITQQITIHAYKKDTFIRAVTLGMSKFALPDLVVEDFSWSLNRNMGHIMNMFAQVLAEGATIEKAGEFDLNFRAIKNARVRDPQIETLSKNATGIALLSLKQGTHDEGDPPNRLVEIDFVRGQGPDIHAKQEQIISTAFGYEDQIQMVEHNAALLAASAQARTKLPSLREAFNRGFAPGEHVLVKAPFEKPDGGSEWMWVEVNQWIGDKITGTLANEPYAIPTLHAGQVVEVSESDIFDCLHKHADGTTDGNTTGEIIARQQK